MRLVAAYGYPDLTSRKWQARLVALYREVAAAYNPADDPQKRVENLNAVFFGQMGFQANTHNFHAPENSYLNGKSVKNLAVIKLFYPKTFKIKDSLSISLK